MTDLVGAWACNGASLAALLSEADRAAMRRHLLGNPQREIQNPKLWLVAGSHKMRTQSSSVVAWEGFVADGGTTPVDALRGPADQHEGQYVMVHSDGESLAMVRALSGGERMYMVRVGDLLLFAASLRPLLAHSRVTRTLDPDVTNEMLLTGHAVFGTQTPIQGIEEVLPGHIARVGNDGTVVQRWHWPQALRSPEGDPQSVARQFHQALCVAIERSIGPSRPVALALSGGIDSSAIAAAAVEVVGADAIHAFTYEFDDPTHAPPETGYARAVAKALGIVRHDVFKVNYKEFLDAIPEHVWRSESAVHWPKAFLLPVARTIASHGYDRYLTGFGIGSHMAYLGDLARVLPWIPFPTRTLRYWRRVRFDAWDWLIHLGKLHPGLEPPHPRLYDMLLQMLERRGVIDNHSAFYPQELQPLLQRRRGGDAMHDHGGDPHAPLAEALQRQAFAHQIACVDITRSEKASREVGVHRIAPAHFAGCIPYAFFPMRPAPRLWSRERALRPGKHLLRLAYRGVIPDEVLFRVKSWDDAVTSRAWRKRGRVFMLRALPRFPNDLDALGIEHPDAVLAWEPTSIQASCLSFWFWNELFVRRAPRRSPPTWTELWGYSAPFAERA